MDDSEIDVSLMNSSNFDEDSMCTCHEDYNEEKTFNWRGWRNPHQPDTNQASVSSHPQTSEQTSSKRKTETILSLLELAAKNAACHIPFEIVENHPLQVPEELQLRIIYWGFPESEDEIRLYACLANGNSNEYDKAENMIRNFSVQNVLQIGFYISASVPHHENSSMKFYDVSLTFDRRRIVKSTCTCPSNSVMCCHIIAVCLNRILYPQQTTFRLPVSDSLSKLNRDQLQKFAQYLIKKLPQQILPSAQKILDDLITDKKSLINITNGAPDPTAGPSADEKTNWCLDLGPLHEGIRKTLIKLTVVSPEITSDVEYLNSTPPHYTLEFSSFLKPLRGKDPEAMWNLISIVKNLMKKGDENSVTILKVITEEIVECDHVICWWFITKTRLKNNFNYDNFLNINSNLNNNNRGHIQNFSAQSMQASSYMCDEIVHLWRLTVLNPKLSVKEKEEFYEMIKNWHLKIMKTIYEQHRDDDSIINDLDKHPGFKSALRACLMDWSDYLIPGVTCAITNNPSTSKINENPVNENEICDLMSSNLNLTTDCSLPQSSDTNNEKASTSNETIEQNLNNKNSNENDNDQTLQQQIDDIKPSTSGLNKRSIDEELNFLYKHKITSANNDLNCKYPHVKQPQRFPNTFSISKDDDLFELKLARAETLYAHGLDKYASDLVIDLANNMLENPPRINVELSHNQPQQTVSSQGTSNANSNPNSNSVAATSNSNASSTTPITTTIKDVKVKKTKSKNLLISVNLQASEIYTKIIFLCNVLINNNIRLDLAFRVGLLGLELAKPPAIIKALEVKLYYQELELLSLLKKIPLNKPEMDLLREKGRQIRDGTLKRGSLLPLTLANLIFDALVLSETDPQKTSPIVNHRLPVDDYIGFECAVATMGLKCPFSEKEHPILWEGIRRQLFDLIINALVHYKNKDNRLVRIIEKLIEKDNYSHSCRGKNNASFSSNQFKNNKTSSQKVTNGTSTPTPLNSSNNSSTSPMINDQNVASTSAQSSQLSVEDELIEYQRKYSKCNCTLNDLNSKIVSPFGPNYSYTYNLTHSPRPKDKIKTTQVNGYKSVIQINFQFMLDLAKNLLTKAGGNSTEKFDGRNIRNIVLIKPHRKLHFCSFILGLYALGLSNQFTKWLQRTFSSHVSWIQHQAKEIGTQAINCLITTWKGYLTPQETAVIVCTGITQSLSRDPIMLWALAELALSTLSEAQALSFYDIKHAINFCKQRNEDMLIKALISIERSNKKGGLSSDILFETAKQWYDLYTEQSQKDLKDKQLGNCKRKMIQNQVAASTITYPPYANVMDYAALNGFNHSINQANAANRLHSQLIFSIAPPPFNAYNCPPPPIYYPGFVYPPLPNAHPLNGTTLQPHFNFALNNYNLHHMIPPSTPSSAMFNNYNSATMPNMPTQAGQAQQSNSMNQHRFLNARNQYNGNGNHPNATTNKQHINNQLTLPTPPLPSSISNHVIANSFLQPTKSRTYLSNAFNLGMMALDALPKKSLDPIAKFDPNPQYNEEIIWLAKIAFGLSVVQQKEFLLKVSKCVSSPFILYNLVMAVEEIPFIRNLDKNLYTKLIDNTQNAFEQCLDYKINFLTTIEYEDYARIVMKAKDIYARSLYGFDAFVRKLDSIRNICKDRKKEKLLISIDSMLKNNCVPPNHNQELSHTIGDQASARK